MFTAKPDVNVPDPRISKFVLFVCRLFGRIYLFLVLGIARIVLRGSRHIFEAYQNALSGKSRCIVAFRHPNGGEPQLLMWFILFKLRNLAKKARFRFRRKPHVSFVYGYEVARWGGGIARWIMPNLGAMPVHHAKIDTVGMGRIFKAISDGPYPLAIAPEGQVSYTTESVPRLEQGTVRIGFQAAERISKEGKKCPVEILPVSIHFRYGKMGEWSLARLIKKIERYTGLENREEKAGFTDRLEKARLYILEQNEKRYGIAVNEEKSFNERIDRLIEKALETAEQLLGINRGRQETVDRIYHIRQLCWDRIVLPGKTSLKHMTLVERALADLRAGEAWHAGRHMELVDFIWYFRIPVPSDKAPLYEKIEYAQNLWDFANRTMGGAYPNRVLNVHPKRVLIQVAPKIDLSARLAEYKKNKKEAIGKAMDDLVAAFQDCIHEAAEYQI
ncbi:MAG: acyltransferase [Treponema sp.]|nr:acyltransferase [Treponema sp.]